jgi:histone H3/H4
MPFKTSFKQLTSPFSSFAAHLSGDGNAANPGEMTQTFPPAAKPLPDVEKDTDLPRALVKKIVKNKVNQTLASATPGEAVKDIQINKDALLAFSESAKVSAMTIRDDSCKSAVFDQPKRYFIMGSNMIEVGIQDTTHYHG